MGFFAFFRSIRVRLGLLIILAMAALVGYLVVDAIGERSNEEERSRENLRRLAEFAATAERTRFDATENFFTIVQQSEVLTNVAAAPADQEAYDGCTRGLYISDQLVPGTRFSLWDTNGQILCSSRGAQRGQFNAAGHAWFEQAKQQGTFATGKFELLDETGDPSLTFGSPIRDPATNAIVAYLSGHVSVKESDLLPGGESLPETGRLTVIDHDGTIINSTAREPGARLTTFPPSIAGLGAYGDSTIEEGSGRTGAAVRITDSEDALVAVIVSADTSTLATPLDETIVELLIPIALLTLITLIAVWLLGQRWIVRPIESLGAASDALASGELEARANVHSGVSELDQLAARFNEMAETSERASQAKDEFLGLISHELKTPITTALGNAAILRSRGDGLDAELRETAIQDIHESTVRLAAIVDNLLVLARLERGVGLETEPLSLLRMAQVTADRQRRDAPGRVIVVQGEQVLALGGETYVEQVLQNLIGNALKYSPADQAVEVQIGEVAGEAIVRVYDRGPGVDESEAEAIFEPFYRSTRTSDVAEGIGIGLSVCKRLVEAMGGRIWAVARPGGGTEFGFSLPRVPEEALRMPTEEALAVAATT